MRNTFFQTYCVFVTYDSTNSLKNISLTEITYDDSRELDTRLVQKFDILGNYSLYISNQSFKDNRDSKYLNKVVK